MIGVIRELEDYLKVKEVKLAIIDGVRLHEIASLNLATVYKEDLVSCISNIEEIKASSHDKIQVSEMTCYWAFCGGVLIIGYLRGRDI